MRNHGTALLCEQESAERGDRPLIKLPGGLDHSDLKGATALGIGLEKYRRALLDSRATAPERQSST